jgi:hypothetical protein
MFLKKVAIRANDLKISVDDVYANDPLYQQFIESIVDLLSKFAVKFKITDEKMLDMFTKHLKREI